MNSTFAKEHRMTLKPLAEPFAVRNVDGTENIMGWVRHTTTQIVRIYSQDRQAYHEESAEFYITDIDDHDMILGTDWLDEHNPEIDWTLDRVDMTRCPPTCTLRNPPVTNLSNKPEHPQTPIITRGADPRQHHHDYHVWFTEPLKDYVVKPAVQVAGKRIRTYHRRPILGKIFTEDDNERLVIPDEWVAQALKLANVIRDLDDPTLIPIRAGFTKAQELAEQAADKTEKSFEQLVPEAYRDFRDVFDKKKSERFPDRRPWDHAIDLKPDFEPELCKVYSLSPSEQQELKTFLDEHLKKGYIRPSKSPMASPFFFVKKKDGKLRPVQDYRHLNSGTVKNEYPLPLVPELVDKLKGAKVFSKVDVRWGYNNI